MAASWALNEQMEKLNARITTATEGLSRYFSLPDTLQTALDMRPRKNLRDPLNAVLEKQVTMQTGIADLLESLLTHLSGQDQEMIARSSLPEDFPARNALARAGIMSVEQLAGMKEDDLSAISGIGKTQASRIVVAEHALLRNQERAKLAPKIQTHVTDALSSSSARRQETEETSPSSPAEPPAEPAEATEPEPEPTEPPETAGGRLSKAREKWSER